MSAPLRALGRGLRWAKRALVWAAVLATGCGVPRVTRPAPSDAGRVCDGGTRSCRTDADCRDLQVCNGSESCVNGCCEAGIPLRCASPYQCVRTSCVEPEGCNVRRRQALCRGLEVCTVEAGCVDISSVSCTWDRDCEFINEERDACQRFADCDPVNHWCRFSIPPPCNDGDACTVDQCDGRAAPPVCVFTPSVDFATDVNNCGACGARCAVGAPHQQAAYRSGSCTYTCDPGWADANRDPYDGCECGGGSGVDHPDLAFVDSNCDGIDGDARRGVFVATTGSDTNPGTMATPVATIQQGMLVAQGNGATDVYVAGGQYFGPVDLVDGIGLFGGYDPSLGWSRSPANTTTIASRTSAPALRGSNLMLATEAQLFTIRSQSATTPGSSSIAVRFLRSPGPVTLRACTITSGDGAQGIDGNGGVLGVPGSDGSSGSAGTPGATTGGAGATAVSSTCAAGGGAGGAGGFASADGLAGANGLSPGPSAATLGGAGGLYGGCGGARVASTRGGDGAVGARGVDGTNGSGNVTSAGLSAAGDYFPPVASSGSVGQAGAGGGGGGGGGGGAATATCAGDPGGGGGAGGGGGCPGSWGTGGHGGGGSFGVVSLLSTVVLDACTLLPGNGGAGGRGGSGATGGTGGRGGAGGGSLGNGSPGGSGGLGGTGGTGGSGAGGDGGPSVCVAYAPTAPTIAATTVCVPGGGGVGGAGGSTAAAGNAGTAVDTAAY